MGGLAGTLGFPVSDEQGVASGRVSYFAGQQCNGGGPAGSGSAIYWTSATGAHEVQGCIYAQYIAAGGPGGSLGFPVTDEMALPNGRISYFQNGYITWLNNTAVVRYPAPLTFRSAPGYGNGDYVSAELGYTGASYAMLRARAATAGSWESWSEYPLGGNLIALRNNANGQFVTADLGYTGANQYELHAGAAHIGPWEEFHIITNSDGTYSLQSAANGLYVSAELAYTGSSYAELRARSSAIGPWEKFTTSTAAAPPPSTCVNYGSSTITGPDSCAGTFITSSVWFSGGGVGLLGQEIWTYGNGTVQDSTATYQLSGLDVTRVYQLQAYIPNNDSDASNAHYHYCAPGGGCADGYVNQNNYTNAWATFGATCTTDGTATITLADDGGDVYPAIIGADAIRAVRTSLVC
jgi:uncharacterized protein with LGFP repeats